MSIQFAENDTYMHEACPHKHGQIPFPMESHCCYCHRGQARLILLSEGGLLGILQATQEDDTVCHRELVADLLGCGAYHRRPGSSQLTRAAEFHELFHIVCQACSSQCLADWALALSNYLCQVCLSVLGQGRMCCSGLDEYWYWQGESQAFDIWAP